MTRRAKNKSIVIGTRLYIGSEYEQYLSNVRQSGLDASDYNRARLLQNTETISRRASKNFTRRQNELAQKYEPASKFLALFNHSGVPECLREVALLAKTGELVLSPQTNADLSNACRDVSRLVRQILTDTKTDSAGWP